MKLQSLTLSNFSSHVQTTLDFAKPVTLICGHLNSGKSSIAAALEYALTAETERYRKKNANFTDLIHDVNRTPDSRFVVSLKTAEGTIKRGRAMTGPAFCSWEGEVDGEPKAYAAWKTSRDILGALLQTGDFFDKEAKDQKELVLRLVGARVTTDAIHKAYAQDKSAFGLLAIKDFDSIQSLDNAYDEAYKLRTVLNRDLKALQPPPMPEGEQPPIDGILKRIKTLEDERSLKQRELGAARAKANTASPKLFAQKQLDDLNKWLDDNQPPTDEEINGFREELRQAEAGMLQLTDRLLRAQNDLTVAKAEELLHSKNHEILLQFKGKCVVGNHDCPATREQMGKAKDEEFQLAKKNADAVKTLVIRVDEANRLSRDRTGIVAIERKIADAEHKGQEFDRRDAEAAKLEEQIKGMAEEVAADPAVVEKLEKDITELDTRLATGRKTLDNAKTWVLRKEQVDAVAAKRAALEKQSTQLEALVEFFGPKGVKVRLIEEKTAAFSEMVNAGAKAFGFEFSFETEPWRILAKGRSVDRLSRSERFRLGVALQVAIAKTTGVNLCVIDNAEHLTPDARSQMFGLLLKSGVQAIVIATSMKTESEFKASAPKVPGMQVLWVKNENGVSTLEVL